MEGLMIYFFVLIILIVALLKWNLANLEKIKDLKMTIEEMNVSHNSVCKEYNEVSEENTRFKELLEIQNKIITDLQNK